MITITIKEITHSALSETSGLLLRNKIEILLNELSSDDSLNLDFTDIRLFGSSFFNSSIGYLVKKYGKDFVTQKIKLSNITELGQKTYERCYNNAVKQYSKKIDTIIGEITQKNIEES